MYLQDWSIRSLHQVCDGGAGVDDQASVSVGKDVKTVSRVVHWHAVHRNACHSRVVEGGIDGIGDNRGVRDTGSVCISQQQWTRPGTVYAHQTVGEDSVHSCVAHLRDQRDGSLS